MAALEALNSPDDMVDEMVMAYGHRRRLLVKGLSGIGLPCVEPKGAFYAFPSIKATGLTSEAFAEGLLREEQVAVVPGSAFGQAGEGYVRCCYAVSTGDQTSNLLPSMVRADGLAIIPAEVERVPAGTEVPVQLLRRDDLRAAPGF